LKRVEAATLQGNALCSAHTKARILPLSPYAVKQKGLGRTTTVGPQKRKIEYKIREKSKVLLCVLYVDDASCLSNSTWLEERLGLSDNNPVYEDGS